MSQVYLQYVAVVADASMYMTDEYIIGLTDIFFYMDSDCDGLVTFADLHVILDKNRSESGEIRWISFEDVIRWFMVKKNTDEQCDEHTPNVEYIAGLKEGFVFFTDRLLSYLVRKLEFKLHDNDDDYDRGHHIVDQMSYTEFIRTIIAHHRERAQRPIARYTFK
jgi:hypothetical protein